jgi:hypothetical protein
MNPNVGGIGSLVMSSDSLEKTSFVDASIPLAQVFYYKLYVDVGARFIESDNVKIELDNFLILGSASVVRFLVDSNWVVVGDEFNGRVSLVDYETRKLLNIVPSQIQTSAFVEFLRKNNELKLLWWGFGTANPTEYSMPTLTQSQSYNLLYAGYSMVSNPTNGLLFATQYDYNNAFTVRRQDDLSIIKSYYRNDYYYQRSLALLNPSNNQILEASNSALRTYRVTSSNGNITNNLETVPFSNNNPFQYIPVSPDGNHFIPFPTGDIYNQSLNVVGKLPVPFNGQYTDITFSHDGQYIYTINNDFQFGNGTLINKWAFPSLDLSIQKRISGVTPRDIQSVADGIVLVGTVNLTGTPQTLIKKYSF